jgi:hypothetical protein
MIEEETKGNGITGLIPDFFHDVIAYLTPGYTFIFLAFINVYVATRELPFKINDVGLGAFFIVTVLAYVVGRFLEQVGYICIHHRKFPFFGKTNRVITPKWGLVFDENDNSYTKAFKTNIAKKVEEWLVKQNGKALMEECKNNKKDDYFNIIQFYLRERFPLVALYEKKQNATIVLTRSLAVGFFLNIILYFFTLHLLVPIDAIKLNIAPAAWIVMNILFSVVLYSRFQQDKKYHAMYIYETFIAMKKLLRKNTGNNTAAEQKDNKNG